MRFRDRIKGFFTTAGTSIDDLIVGGDLNTPITSLNSGGINPYLENIYDTIAKDFANMIFKEVPIDLEKNEVNLNSEVNNLLLKRPNQLQTPFDFKELFAKCAVKYGHGIAIPVYSEYQEETVYINEQPYIFQTSGGKLKGFKAINVANLRFGHAYKEIDGTVYLVYEDLTLQQIVTIPYDDVIHVRYKADSLFFGERFNTYNFNPIKDIFNANITMMLSKLGSSNKVSGILKMKSVLGEEKLKKGRLKTFTDTFLGGYSSNPSGIVVLDPSEEFIPLDKKFEIIGTEDLNNMTDILYKFFGLNENLLTCNYTEAQYSAYKKHTLMPLAQKFAEELTYKVCKENYQVKYYDFNFNGATLKDITLFIDKTIYHGILPPNWILETILGLEPYKGGDTRYTNLNAVPLTEKSEYLKSIIKELNSLRGGDEDDKRKNGDV